MDLAAKITQFPAVGMDFALPRLPSRFPHCLAIAFAAACKPRETHIADEPDVPVSLREQMLGGVVGSPDVVGVNDFGGFRAPFAHHIVPEHRERNLSVGERLQQVGEVDATQDYPASGSP